MTGYHFTIGYNGVSSKDYMELWKILKLKTREICNDPAAIVAEARRLGSPETCTKGKECCNLGTYADNYALPLDTLGHPVSIFDDEEQIMQLASTDDAIKYHIRRAFVRLLIEAMHREEIEVNLRVC